MIIKRYLLDFLGYSIKLDNIQIMEHIKDLDEFTVEMETGTGKTFTVFQIIHRLRESGLKKKNSLYLR